MAEGQEVGLVGFQRTAGDPSQKNTAKKNAVRWQTRTQSSPNVPSSVAKVPGDVAGIAREDIDALDGELREALEGLVADVQGSVGDPHYSQPPSILHLFEYSEHRS